MRSQPQITAAVSNASAETTANHSPQPAHAKTPGRAIRAAAITIMALTFVITGLTGSHAVSADTHVPSAPLNLEAAVISATQIDLNWDAPTHAGPYPPIRGYRIWVSTGANSAWTRLVHDTGSTTTAYSHTGLSERDYRRYRVAAIDESGGEGERSNIASATIAVPTAPLNLAATPGNKEVTLTWIPPADDWAGSIQKYRVRHGETGGNYGSWSDIAGAAAARTHTVIGLTNDIQYTFQVRAVNPVGAGAEGSVEETPFSLADAATPLNLAAAAGYKEVTLTWDPPPGSQASAVEKYQVRHAEIDGDYGAWADVTGGDEARTHTVTGLTNFQKYRFQLNAVTTLGSTENPPGVEATPLNFGMWVTNVSIKRGSNVVGERKTPVYVYAPSTRVETDTTFALTWGGRPTTELHPDNPTTVTIKAGEHISWAYLWAAADQDNPPVYNQPVKGDVVAKFGALELRDPLIVRDDEPLPVVKLSAPATVAEGDTFKVTATLQHRLDVDTTVPINMVNPSQMTVRDSTGVFGWPYPAISIPAGQLTGQTVSIHKQQDNVEDGYGNLNFGVNGISPYHWWPSHEQATVRITDDDTEDPNKRRYAGWPRLIMGDAWAEESGDPGAVTKMRMQITLYPTSRSQVTVEYRTEDGSARAGVNYRSASGTLTFAPRERRKTVEIDILDDGLGGHTSFRLIAVGPNGGGAEVGTYYVTGRIYDETPTFRSWPESARESGNGSSTGMSFHVSLLDFHKDGTYTIDYATQGGTATAGADYTAISGTLTFEPGEPGQQLVAVPILDDSFADSGETFHLVLSNPTGGSQLNRWHRSVTGTIHDDDNTPGVSASFPSSASTSGSHTGADDRPRIVAAFSEAVANFTKTTPSVSVTNASITSVQAHTEDGPGNAYIFTFDPAGDDDITFALIADAECDSGGICSPGGTKLLGVPPMFTIAGPTSAKRHLAVSDTTASEDEDSTLVFTITLDRAADNAITVDYATADGTATAGKDYTAKSGTLTFNAGETSKTIHIPILNDTIFDKDETIQLSLSNASGADISDQSGTGTITDTDLPPDPLRASFVGMPAEHDGAGAISFLLDLNGVVNITEEDMRDHAFVVTGGTVTSATTVNDNIFLWRITVDPSSDEDVNITLPAHRDCDEAGAICTTGDNQQQLSNSPSATVTGPTEDTSPEDTSPDATSDPLTASFSNVPDSHDGSTGFTFDLAFSENVEAGYGRIRDHTFTIDGGDIKQAQRKEQGSNQTWTITVEPDGNGAVSITLPETTDCGAAGAICTQDGRKLSTSLDFTVPRAP